MTPRRLGRLVQADDSDRQYAESYRASGLSVVPLDRSSEFDLRGWSDTDLALQERWAYYYVTSNVRPREIHRLRAIHAEQQRRRTAGES